eukprot:13428192-Alexandrium_andersonii.AAC.1
MRVRNPFELLGCFSQPPCCSEARAPEAPPEEPEHPRPKPRRRANPPPKARGLSSRPSYVDGPISGRWQPPSP